MSLDRRAMEAALPNYELGAELGRGAFGLVFAGRHRTLDRPVAVKQLPRALAADDATRQRFLIESRTIAALQHPHIVPVYDFVERDGLHLLVMELLDGGSLADRAAQGISVETACTIVADIASALAHAHTRGVLHRDVKPENILFTKDGVAKLADFGIAKLVEQPENLTMTGTVVGTPAYMAPEVALGEPAGPAADIYSLGVVLYELLAGRPPYPSRPTAAAALLQRVSEDPAPLGAVAPHLPPALTETVMRAIGRDPASRFADAASFASAVRTAAPTPAEAVTAAAAPPAHPSPTGDRIAAENLTQAPMGIVAPDRLPGSPRRRGAALLAVAVVACLVAAIAVLATVGGGGDDTATGSTGAAGTTSVPATATGEAAPPALVALTEATAKFRNWCSGVYTETQCQCSIEGIQRELGLAVFVEVANEIALGERPRRPAAVSIVAQCGSR